MGPPPNDALNNLLASLVEKHQVEVVPNPHRDGNWSRLLEEWNTTTGQNIKDGVIISRKWTNLKQQIKKKMSREIQYVINNAEDSSNSSINNISSITDPASSSGIPPLINSSELASNHFLASLVEKHNVEQVKNPHKDGNWSRVLEEWNMTTGQNVKDCVTISKKWTNYKQQVKKKMMPQEFVGQYNNAAGIGTHSNMMMNNSAEDSNCSSANGVGVAEDDPTIITSMPGTSSSSVKRSGKRLRMTMEHALAGNLNLSHDPYAEEKWQKFHFEAILAEEKVLHNRKMQTYEESIKFYEVMAAKQKAMNAGYVPKETDPFYDEKMLEGSTTTNQELGGFAVMDSSETEADGRDSLEVTPDIISNNDHEQAVFVKREEEVEI